MLMLQILIVVCCDHDKEEGTWEGGEPEITMK